jgi:hypothetical protein
MIRAMFPDREELVERSYRDNRPFRELCDDYRKCVAALEHWKQLDTKTSAPRCDEYTDLLAELRGEIRIWLEAMESGSYREIEGSP